MTCRSAQQFLQSDCYQTCFDVAVSRHQTKRPTGSRHCGVVDIGAWAVDGSSAKSHAATLCHCRQRHAAQLKPQATGEPPHCPTTLPTSPNLEPSQTGLPSRQKHEPPQSPNFNVAWCCPMSMSPLTVANDRLPTIKPVGLCSPDTLGRTLDA